MTMRPWDSFLLLTVVLSLDLTSSIPDSSLPHDFTLSRENFDPSHESDLGQTRSLDLQVNYRLPNQVKPLHYKLEIRPILDEARGIGWRFTAPGEIKIRILALTNTKNITLHAEALKIDGNSVRVKEEGNGTMVPVTSTTFNAPVSFFIIGLGGPGLGSGKRYEICIQFITHLSWGTSRGFGLNSYYDSTERTTRYFAQTHFRPTEARRAFPCFDEPALKATWTITVLRQAGYHSLSNSKLLKSEPMEGNPGWYRDTFATTLPISTYLSELENRIRKMHKHLFERTFDARMDLFDGKPVGIWGPPEVIATGAGKFGVDFAAKTLSFLQKYLKTQYELPKMDLVSLPNFPPGAMEGWGLNTYRESKLLFLEGTSTVEDKYNLVSTISHQLAHQWFGNHVGQMWWNDLWLSEGFAGFLESKVIQELVPELESEELILQRRALQEDGAEEALPLSPTIDLINNNTMLRKMYSWITYSKGVRVIRMMEGFLSEGTLLNGLKDYLTQKRFGVAQQSDLFKILQNHAINSSTVLPPNLTVSEIMESWTLRPGYPILRVSRDSGVDKLQITQERFFNSGPPMIPTPNQWNVPITYTLQGQPLDIKTKHWLLDREQEFIAPVGNLNRWILVNPTAIGFYRVLYSDADFEALIQQLQNDPNEIDPASRSSLIDDALNLGFAGYTSLENSLNLTRYMRRELELSPWITFLDNMKIPHDLFKRSSIFLDFKKYMLTLLKGPLNLLGFEEWPNEPESRTRLRTRLMDWACGFGYSPCVVHAEAMFKTWIKSPITNPIAPDQRATVYCTAMANGDEITWDFIVSQYKTASKMTPYIRHFVDSTQVSLVKALGCSKETYRLSKLLDLALDSKSFLLFQHRSLALQGVAENPGGTRLIFHFLRNHFDAILPRLGQRAVAGVITTLSNYINNDLELADLEAFIKTKEGKLGGVKSTLQASIEKVKSNLWWMERHYEGFKSWLAHVTN